METALARLGAWFDNDVSEAGHFIVDQSRQNPWVIAGIVGLLLGLMFVPWFRYASLRLWWKTFGWRAKFMGWRRPALVRRIASAVTDLVDNDYLVGKISRTERIQAFMDLGRALKIDDLVPRKKYKNGKLPTAVQEKMKDDIKKDNPRWLEKLQAMRVRKAVPPPAKAEQPANAGQKPQLKLVV